MARRYIKKYRQYIYFPLFFGLCLLGIFNSIADAKTEEAKIYRPIPVSAALLSTSKVETYPAETHAHCALQANRMNWAYLLHYSDHQCSLYELKLPSDHNDTADDTVMCHTKLHQDCVGGRRVYKHGRTVNFGNNCVLKQCRNTKMYTYFEEVNDTCSDDFFKVPGIGCITHVRTPMTYDEASDNCTAIGGQLVVPMTYEAYRKHMGCKSYWHNLTGEYWIGMRDSHWSDGNPVNIDDWAEDAPNSTVHCGYASDYDSSKFEVHDGACDSMKNFTCQEVFP